MRNTLATLHYNDIAHLVSEGGNSTAAHKIGLRAIHSEEVEKYIQSAPPNKVLNAPPPEIHTDEKTLPRKTRSTLSQLRSGYSTYLNSFMSIVDKNRTPNCPKCDHALHDTHHLFNCPNDVTDLEVLDFWRKPKETAEFLGLDIRGPNELDDGNTLDVDPG